MRQNFIIKCYNCHTPIYYPQNLIEEKGVLLVFRCPNCEKLSEALAHYSCDQKRLSFTLTLSWNKSSPTLGQIKGIRLLIARFQTMPVIEVKKYLENNISVEIEELGGFQARELAQKAEVFGLKAELTKNEE